MKEKVLLTECKVGSILAEDVCNENGVVLAAKNTIMNRYIIGHLMHLGVGYATIYRDISRNEGKASENKLEDSYKKSLMQTKELIQNIAAGKPLEYEKVYLLANQIHKNIHENSNIIKLLTEVRNKDDYTYTHSLNTAYYSMLISRWLNLPENEIMKAIQSGLLHDIGKTRIPHEILNKSGRLTEEEYDLIKKHSQLGYEIVKDSKEIDEDVKLAILLHHERINGSGYPFHCFADNMNLHSRIVAMADVFDAMTSERVYKKRATPFEVFDMYLTEGLCLFDTKMLYVFMNNMAVNLLGVNVLLNNGKTGEIVYIPFHKLTSPVVKIASEYVDISEEKELQILKLV